MRRARYCVFMRELSSASNLYLMELFQEIRDNNSVFEDIENEAIALMDEDMLFYYNSIKEAYILYLNKNYSEAISHLDRIPATYNRILLAEKDLLKSRCLSKTLNKDKRQLAVNLLEKYKNNSAICSEADLWERMMTSLITAYYHTGQREKAKSIEEEVLSSLATRSKFDKVAQHRIHILYRNSNSIHSSEFAEGLIEKSVNYFLGKNNYHLPYNILEYYKALLNYSATLCKNGKFTKSFLQTKIAIKLQNDFPDIHFPREQIIFNNFAVSGFLSRQLNMPEVIEIMESICKKTPLIAEKLFYITNLSIFYILDGNILLAKKYLEEETTKFNVLDDLEGSYKYKIYLTFALISYLENDIDVAKKNLKIGFEAINFLTDNSYIRKKFELLFDLFNSRERTITPYTLDKFLLEKTPVYQNSVWKFIGRTFPYSILSNWDI